MTSKSRIKLGLRLVRRGGVAIARRIQEPKVTLRSGVACQGRMFGEGLESERRVRREMGVRGELVVTAFVSYKKSI